METLDNIRNGAKDFLSEECRAEIQTRLSKILQGKPNDALTLVFCGTFSSGKSSMINELLNLRQNFKLPAGANPVTKFLTRLKYGKKFSACYIWHGAEYPLSLSDLDEIITGKLSLPDDSAEVVIRLPARILRGGNVEILDTPGYLDNQELTELTRAAVAAADIALFCCNATAAGKKFEIDYFRELEDTIGNFAVIINYMDSINTAEDFQRVKNFMEGNVAGRGRAILHFTGMEKLFFTAAGGRNVDLGEFRKFFSLLCSGLSQKFIRRLQQYAYRKRTIHALQILRNEVQTQIYFGGYFYACANAETDSEHQKARKIFLTECKQISESAENILTDGKKLLEAAAADIEREFDSLEAQDYVFNFRDKATAYLRGKLQTVPNTLRERLKKIFPSANFDDKNFFAEYIAAVNNYSVPEPVGRRVAKSGVSNFLSSVFGKISGRSKTENYEIVYENYAAAAKVHLREKLLDQLQSAMTKYFRSLAAALKPPPPSKGDALIEEIAACKLKWETLDAEIAKYLNFCLEKFMWGLSKDPKFFPITDCV